MSEDRYSDIDDFFHERLNDFNPSPGEHIWGRLEGDLTHPLDEVFEENSSAFQPEAPIWVWKSLSYFLATQKKYILRKYLMKVTGTFGMLLLVTVGIFQYRAVNEALMLHGTSPNEGSSGIHVPLKHYNLPGMSFGPSPIAGVFQNLKETFRNAEKESIRETNRSQNPIAPETEKWEEMPFPIAKDMIPLGMTRKFAFTPSIMGISLSGTYKKPSEKKYRNLPFNITFSWGVAQTYRNLEGQESFVDVRNRAERAAYGRSVKMTLGMEKGRWYFQTGVALQQYSENVSFTYQTQVNTVKEVMFRDVNRSAYFTVPVHYQMLENKVLQSTNRYQYLEIPVQVGYVFHTGRVNIIPIAGIAMAFRTGSQGKTLMERNGSPIEINLARSGGLIHRNTAWFAQTAVKVQIPVSRKHSLEFEPFAGYSITNNLKTTGTSAQRFYAAGARLGYVVKF